MDNVEDWNVACPESVDPVARCLRNVQEVDAGMSSNNPDGNGYQRGAGAQPIELDILRFKEAKRREHFEGMMPGSLTPCPWRSTPSTGVVVLGASADGSAVSPAAATTCLARLGWTTKVFLCYTGASPGSSLTRRSLERGGTGGRGEAARR